MTLKSLKSYTLIRHILIREPPPSHPKYSVSSFYRMKTDFPKFMVKFELTDFFSFVQSKKPKYYQKSVRILIGRLYRLIYGRENCGRESSLHLPPHFEYFYQKSPVIPYHIFSVSIFRYL
jgi:hypothetical protein